MKEQRARVFQREKREKKDRVRDIQKEEGETLWERHKQPQKIKISKPFPPPNQTDRQRERREI